MVASIQNSVQLPGPAQSPNQLELVTLNCKGTQLKIDTHP